MNFNCLFVVLIINLIDTVISEKPLSAWKLHSMDSSPSRPSSSGAIATSHSRSSSAASRSLSSSFASSSSHFTKRKHNRFESFCNYRNATFKEYPNPCPSTCANPEGVKNCTATARKLGCECYPGYVLSDNGDCMLLRDCPDYFRCNGDRNATYKECPNPCPRTCLFPGETGPCGRSCMEEGCECKEGYYLGKNGKCVEFQDCPGKTACTPNEAFVFCKASCPTDYCPVDDNRATIACSPPFPCGSGCICKANYLRRSTKEKKCVPASKCSPVQCSRPNEVWDGCPAPCRKERCSDISNPPICDKRFHSCRPQCICKPGYYRNDADICVPEKQCLLPTACGFNEEPSNCKITCPPQSCDSVFTTYRCDYNAICEPGCNCKNNYLRNTSGICVPSDQCFSAPPPIVCGFNEEPTDCNVTCPPQSCESIFTSYACDNNTACEPGCKCKENHLRNASGICVPSDQCFLEPECDVPIRCRSTCANPNPQDCTPTSPATENIDGCNCKPGFILSELEGLCIRIQECPVGNSCGVNGTFSECAFRCPNQNCPEDDSLSVIACKPGRPCPSGCVCKNYYRRKNENDDACVLASDCSPVECTRPNEIWNPCASECLAESCSDINQKTDCIADPKNCQPKCVCCSDHFRNETGSCVAKKYCKKQCPVDPKCRPTCAVPNPPECPFIQPSNIDDDNCNCQQGHILSEVGGKCIKIEDCPPNTSCNGDPNAIVRQFPPPCPSTCGAPNAVPCKKMPEPIGCECKPGYIRSKLHGKCILPDQCKGGNPCGQNSTFVPCKNGCPNFYCPTDDSRARVICEPIPLSFCLSGCMCKLNHKMLSRSDTSCIRSDECPPVSCTRPNEGWNPCPMECSSGYCEEVDTPPVICNTLVLNCNPQCMCKNGFLRNPDNDLCVTFAECRRINAKKQK